MKQPKLKGHRKLKRGEILEKGDIFWCSTAWMQTVSEGRKIGTPGTGKEYYRKEAA